MAKIHSNLKRIRIEKGFTQEEVANRIGLTRQAISGYESGKRQPGIDMLMKLAEIYDVDIECILYGKTERVLGKKTVRKLAIVVASVFLTLQMLTGLFTTLSHVMYPMREGIVSKADIENSEKHFKLLEISDTMEWCASSVLGLGTIIVMVLDIYNKNTFSWKSKIAFYLLILGISWLIAIFWGIVHPTFETINFVYRGPIYFVIVTFFLIIDMVICSLKNSGHLR